MTAHPEKALRFHVGLFLAEAVCATAFIFELDRARSGNTLSWAYVFEWPILGAYAIYMWRKLLHAETEPAPELPPASPDENQALETYNRYLSDLHRGERPPDTGE